MFGRGLERLPNVFGLVDDDEECEESGGGVKCSIFDEWYLV